MSGSGSGIEQIIALIGEGNTITLCQAHGGVAYYIPHEPRPDHKFAKLIGTDAFEQLCGYYGGTRLTLPRMAHLKAKKNQVLARLKQGQSVRRIALEVRCTERYVSRIKSNHERQQMPLFNNPPRADQRPPAPRAADNRQPHHKETAAMK
jgi:Mor family transcriptional regulator